MTFDIDTRDLRRAADGLELADDIAGDAIADVLDEIGAVAMAAAKRGASRHRRTGRMIDQITLRETGDAFGTVVTVHAGGSIAPIIIGGSRPHTIEPIRSRALAIGSRAGGPVERFAERVRHPGTLGDPFLDRAMDVSLDRADQELATAADQVAGELADEITRRV